MKQEYRGPVQDISLGKALCIAAGLALMIVAGKLGLGGAKSIDDWVEANGVALLVSVGLLVVNGFFYGSLVWDAVQPRESGLLGAHRGQGRKKKKFRPSRLGLALLLGGAGATVNWALKDRGPLWLTDLPFRGGGEGLRELLDYNLLAALVATCYSLLSTKLRLGRGKPKPLPPYPVVQNEIVLGSDEPKLKEDEEEDRDEEPRSPEWVSMGLLALRGNVLISGSIGCGKTQGAVLPYLEQILSNFDPRPAVLAIDPKRTFIRRALGIIERLGLRDHCLHIKLGGQVRYNPVYHSKILQGSRTVEIAQMLKAAAINSVGKTNDSFWETSAFNLMKNALVYCGAVLGYFTLIDLYNTVVTAATGNLADDLKRAMKEKTFDQEEKFNIERAIRYFGSEFGAYEHRLKTNILASTTSFLNQFQDFQAARIFSPKEEEITLKSMDDAIDKGKLILFDVDNPALARAMGTLVKLEFQQSLLTRLGQGERDLKRAGVLIIDEYQDVVTSGHGVALGDDRFLAKSREANAMTIAATQSLTSVKNSLRNDEAAHELFQNFRSRIAGASDDIATIRTLQDLVGEVEKERVSVSVTESANDDSLSLFGPGGGSRKPKNVSAGTSTSTHKEPVIKPEEFASLEMFETFARIFDGSKTTFRRLYLKPHFLSEKALLQEDVLKAARKGAALLGLVVAVFAPFKEARAGVAPNVCSVVKTPAFDACMATTIGSCMCPGIPPRPCALISYYRPETFIEVQPNAGATRFGALPAVARQVASVGAQSMIPYGAEGEIGSHAYQAHVIDIPLVSLLGNFLPCTGYVSDRSCFAAMSEHAEKGWTTGAPDLKQPTFLAFAGSPKACLELGAAESIAGGATDPAVTSGSSGCSHPVGGIGSYPPSTHTACTGWGPFFPRSGIYEGGSQTAGALMVGARIKSLGSEVFQTVDRSPDEKWEMIEPQPSMCFQEGQNVGFLEMGGGVNEMGRLAGGPPKGFLFAIWRRVTCCKDFPDAMAITSEVAGLKASCAGGAPP